MVMEALKTSNVAVNIDLKTARIELLKILISRSLSLFDLTYNSLEKAPLARCCFCLTQIWVSMGEDLDPRVLLKTIKSSTTTIEGQMPGGTNRSPVKIWKEDLGQWGNNFLKISPVPGLRMFACPGQCSLSENCREIWPYLWLTASLYMLRSQR